MSVWDKAAQDLYEEMLLTAHPKTLSWEKLPEAAREKWRIAAAKKVSQG